MMLHFILGFNLIIAANAKKYKTFAHDAKQPSEGYQH